MGKVELLRKGSEFFAPLAKKATGRVTRAIDTCGLTYAPELRKMEQAGLDVLDINPALREKVTKFNSEQAIAKLKASTIEIDGKTLTFEDAYRTKAENATDELLSGWDWFVDRFGTSPIKKKQNNCNKLLEEFFSEENLKKSELFKSLTKEDFAIMEKLNKSQLLACLSGYKPACYESYPERLCTAIKNSKLAKEYTVIRTTNQACILNNKQVKDIISNNREIFCRELKLDLNTSDDIIFEKLLYSLEHENTTADASAMFGLFLGYPKYSSLIYELNKAALTTKGNAVRPMAEYLLETLHSEKSPFKNYSKEFIDDLEHYIKTENLSNYAHPFEERFFSSFTQYGSDFIDMRRVKQNETDFVNNFTPEWFLKRTNS